MTEVEIKISPKLFNPVYLPYLDDPTRIQIFFGGSSSGKSVFLAQRNVCDVLKGRNILSVRNTANTIRKSSFNEIRKIINQWKLRELFTINKSDMMITARNGKQILFSGLDDTEKLKSITPENGVITDIHLEEATECREEDVKQLEKRLRGRSEFPKRMSFSFNPILKAHWIYKKYFGGWEEGAESLQKKDLFILHTTYKHNEFLDEEDRLALENETDPYWRDVYTLGLWGVLGEVIFKNWKTEDLKGNHWDNIRNGLDFGFGSHPAALDHMHCDKKRGQLFILDEFNGTGLTNPELAKAIRPIVGNQRVVCDSAEPKSIKELQQNKIQAVGAKKGKDSVNFGIQWLQQQEIIIDRKCQNTINEFQAYQWKKNAAGEVLDIPWDKDDHHIDAIRYGCEDLMTPLKKAGPLFR